MALRGTKIVVYLKMGARTYPDSPSFNTVAEIVGNKYPEQVSENIREETYFALKKYETNPENITFLRNEHLLVTYSSSFQISQHFILCQVAGLQQSGSVLMYWDVLMYYFTRLVRIIVF